MKKISYYIGRISKSMRLYFSLMLSNSDDSSDSDFKSYQSCRRFVDDLKETELSFRLHPFITIEYGTQKEFKEVAYTNSILTLTHISSRQFLREIERKIRAIESDSDLFRYDNNDRMYVNQYVLRKYPSPTLVSGNRKYRIGFSVMEERETSKVVEAIDIMVYNGDHILDMIITVDEALMLHDTILSIDYTSLAVQLYHYYMISDGRNDLENVEKSKIITELPTDINACISNSVVKVDKPTFPGFS